MKTKSLKIVSSKTKSGKMVSGVDWISALPEPVIHHIMSFLPSKDITLVGSLSKTWHSLWSTYPNLDFDQTTFERALPHTLYAFNKQILYLTSINRSFQRLEERSMNIHKLKFHAIWLCLFESVVERALKSNVQELDLDYYYDMGKQYCRMPPCLYSAKSVKRVKLMGFEVGIMDLLSGCSSIEELVLERCKGSEEVVKFSSDKLVKFHVELRVLDRLKSIKLDACNLQSFGYQEYSIDNKGVHVASAVTLSLRTCTINLSTCIFLRNLSFKNTKVSDRWLEHNISKLVHLEDLSLDSCELTRVRIYHKKLKRLHLISCVNVEQAEIDCPKLSRFVFKGEVPHFEFFNSSRSLVASLTLYRGTTSWWFWFYKFWRFLGLFCHCKTLKIVCDSFEDLIFPEEVRGGYLPPLHDLKHLEFNCRSPTVDYPQLVDNLLWLSPHLEIMYLNSQVGKHCLKFQYTKKMSEGKGEEDLRFCCCRAYPKKCWRHCLKKVIVDYFDGSANGKKNLLNYLFQNAKGLKSIQDNSTLSLQPQSGCNSFLRQQKENWHRHLAVAKGLFLCSG